MRAVLCVVVCLLALCTAERKETDNESPFANQISKRELIDELEMVMEDMKRPSRKDKETAEKKEEPSIKEVKEHSKWIAEHKKSGSEWRTDKNEEGEEDSKWVTVSKKSGWRAVKADKKEEGEEDSKWVTMSKKSGWRAVKADKKEEEEISDLNDVEKNNALNPVEQAQGKKQALKSMDELVKKLLVKNLLHLKDLKKMKRKLQLERQTFQEEIDGLKKKMDRFLVNESEKLTRRGMVKKVKKGDETRYTDKVCIRTTINGETVEICEPHG